MNLQDELRRTIEEYESINLAKNYLTKLRHRIAILRQDLHEIETLVNQSSMDIAKLESFSLTSLFFELLGDKASQLEQAKQSYLQNILKYRELKRRLELSEYEKNILEKKVARAEQVNLQLNTLLRTRENLLDQTEPELKRGIMALNRKIEQQLRFKTEIKEANNLSYKTIEYLSKMIELLNKIWFWGNMKWFSKLFNNTQSHIDRAQELLYKAKQNIIHLEDKMKHIEQYNKSQVPNFRLELSHYFSEIYIENLILDWVVRGRIKNAFTSIISTRDKIKLLQITLKKQSKDIDQYIEQLELEKKQLLLNKQAN